MSTEKRRTSQLTMAGRVLLETDEPVPLELGVPNESFLGVLIAAGVRTLIIHFDGSGDDGQIQEVEAFREGDADAGDWPTLSTSATYDEAKARREEYLRRRIELHPKLEDKARDLAYSILNNYCPGDWVNNEGGFGQIKICFGGEEGIETTLSFSQRVITLEESETDVEPEELEAMVLGLKGLK